LEGGVQAWRVDAEEPVNQEIARCVELFDDPVGEGIG